MAGPGRYRALFPHRLDQGQLGSWDKNPDYWLRREVSGQPPALFRPDTRADHAGDHHVLVSAAHRSDRLRRSNQSQLRSIDQLESLQRTNPELRPSVCKSSDNAVGMNIQVEPFDDIRIRKALQMALNLEEINQGFFLEASRIPSPRERISRLNATVATQVRLAGGRQEGTSMTRPVPRRCSTRRAIRAAPMASDSRPSSCTSALRSELHRAADTGTPSASKYP